MEVLLYYNESQLEAAVSFIAENNPSYYNQRDDIRKSIQNNLQQIVEKFPNLSSVSTMGYTILAEIDTEEGIDFDENALFVDILVDPSLGSKVWVSTEKFYIFTRDANGKSK